MDTKGKKSPGRAVRGDFPFYDPELGKARAYLDTAASAQKPRQVCDVMYEFMTHAYANIHRGAYALSADATLQYDAVREKVQKYIGAEDSRSIVFTRGATEAINLVASTFGDALNESSVVFLTELEHHSNIVPWQLLAQKRNVQLHFIPLLPDATIDLDQLFASLKETRPALLALTGLSNAFGTVMPLREIIERAHEVGTRVLVDAAQLIVHAKVHVKSLDPDFLVFSGHKLYGPTGIGVLYARTEILEQLPPYQGGGDMISRVQVSGSSWAAVPQKFEAGTPAIAEAIGLGAALDYLQDFDTDDVHAHERRIFEYGLSRLQAEAGVTVHGPAAGKNGKTELQASILPFSVDGIHPHDLASILDTCHVQIRAGHHCAMPALHALGLQSTCRASLALYSDEEDIDMLLEGIRHARKIFQ